MNGRLPVEVVGVIIGATWVLVAVSWAAIFRWEHTGLTEARRQELEQQAATGAPSLEIRLWRVAVAVILVALPLLFVIDGLVDRWRILYAPSLTFSAGPDLVLQIAGIVLSTIGLAILITVGRKLAVNVYRLAVPERRMMSTGVHRYVRHPFYLHFVLIPVGSCLVSLNVLALLLVVAYTTLWEPKTITSWMREEEEDLRRRYGADAEEYLARTGRILPRVRRPYRRG